MALANKYRPNDFEDVVEQSVAVEILKSICHSEELSVRNFLLTGPAGTGKAQPMDSKILTPDRGFVNIGDIQIGDKVYTHNCDISEVDGVFPQGIRKIYKITLEDNTYLEVSDEHNNLVEFEKSYTTQGSVFIQDVLTTRTLINLFETQQFKCYIPSLKGCPDGAMDHISADALDNLSHRTSKDRWLIKNIEYIRDDECQCIHIKHSDHTYISDNFIPTHNTTLARIMSKTINHTDKNSCIEIDAASHGGVGDIREIVEQARIFPLESPWKVFIIDEAHLVSQAGWGAFLKCIEENPGRSVFIFATTNPEKIPSTIISRVQLFQLSKISTDGIFNRLKYVLDSEIEENISLEDKIEYTDDALSLIAKLAYGGMRNALTMVDKVIAYSHSVTVENVVAALNIGDYGSYFDLLSAYGRRDNSEIMSVVDNVYNSGTNFIQWFESFYSFVMQVVKCVLLKDIQKTTIPSYYEERMQGYNVSHINVCIKLSNILVELIHKLKTTQYQLETAMTYLLF